MNFETRGDGSDSPLERILFEIRNQTKLPQTSVKSTGLDLIQKNNALESNMIETYNEPRMNINENKNDSTLDFNLKILKKYLTRGTTDSDGNSSPLSPNINIQIFNNSTYNYTENIQTNNYYDIGPEEKNLINLQRINEGSENENVIVTEKNAALVPQTSKHEGNNFYINTL